MIRPPAPKKLPGFITSLLLIGWLVSGPVLAQRDALSARGDDQRIFRLWQLAPFYPIIQPSYPNLSDSTSLLAQYDSLAQVAQSQHDERLFWYVQLHKLLLRNEFRNRAYGQSTLLLEAQPTLERCPVPVVRASYWYFLGRYEFGKQRFDEGFRWLLRAQQAFEQIGYGNIPEINEYLAGLGGRYFFFGEYAICIRYLEASLRYPALNIRTRLAALNTLGLCYQRLTNYPRAQTLFSRTQQEAQAHHDSAYTAIATTNLGYMLLLRGRAKQGLPYLYQGYRQSVIKVPENAALTALYLAKALLALDSSRKAKTYIDRSTRFYTNQPWSDYELQYLQAQTLYSRKAGDFRQATRYLDSTQLLQDTLRARFNARLLAATQAQVAAERYLSDLRSLETQKTNAVQMRNIILVALGLLAMASGYALRQNKQKRKQEQRARLAQQQRAEERLAQYMAHLEEKNRLIETISTELDQTRKPSVEPVHDPPSPPGIDNLLNRVILTEVDWQQFKQLFEGVYPDFFNGLQSRFTELTPAEIRLLALLKLDISTKQMAYMLGVNTNTIRMSRYRLRRKLEAHQLDPNLATLIRQI